MSARLRPDGLLSPNPPTWVPGKVGSAALEFDGATNFVRVPTSAFLSVGIGTVAAWVRFGAYSDNWPGIVCKSSLNSDANGYCLFTRNAGQIRFHLAEAAGQPYDEYSSLALTFGDQQWHHAAATWDGSSVYIYVDGVAVMGPGSQTVNPVTDVYDLMFGVTPDMTDYLPGAIDDVRVYSRALLPSEVSQLFALGTP